MEPNLWQRARKAFAAAVMAGGAAAGPVAYNLAGGGFTAAEVGAVAGAFFGAAVPAWAVAYKVTNAPSTSDLAAAQRARREALD